MKCNVLALTIFLFLSSMSSAKADATDDLKKEIQSLKQRVSELEQRPGTMASQSVPFSAMEHLENEMDRAFEDVFDKGVDNGMFDSQFFYQASPLEKTKNGYQVKLNVSGFDPKDIKVTAREGMLTVTGKTSRETARQNQEVSASSESYGAFMRKIALPADAMADAVRTSREGDNLIINVPRRP